ncbi:DUF1588 domain-containing protein [Aquisphaera insulae]|uniref:DUF1588 domain-containing protein n=1 Tax=Aquisphaera insulae TaxID=2712864 RepID=UPI0013EAE90A|nr:DUF1588 domain-containing protein [Aquisphaera insulae]
MTAPSHRHRPIRADLGRLVLLVAMARGAALAAEPSPRDLERARTFADEAKPVLAEYCGACHAAGLKKGGVNFDGGDDAGSPLLRDGKLWLGVLKNVRAGLMPPAGEPRPSADEVKALEAWIKRSALEIDPADPDPGRVTVRRLNRIEYRNTVRDLIGVDYDTAEEFPPDDTGFGFDNIGEVLTMSPLLLEKYIAAARTIVARAVPVSSKVVAEHVIPGRAFRRGADKDKDDGRSRPAPNGPLSLSYYEPASVATTFQAEHAGKYRLVLDLAATERFVDGVFDANRCRMVFTLDGAELHRKDFTRQDGRTYRFEADRELTAGPHELTVRVEPLPPAAEKVRSLALRIDDVKVRGPFDESHFVRPADYARFFPRDVPADLAGRRAYAREILGPFASRAFRRPADDATVDGLVAAAETGWGVPGGTFEAGIARAFTVALASPRFLFREEWVDLASSARYPLVDEYALATRLSYFLWSSMPDDELFRLAASHGLRKDMTNQVRRMLASPKSAEFFRHFVGQWLQARDVDSVLINSVAVAGRDLVREPDAEKKRARFRELNRKPPEELTEAEKSEIKEARAAFASASRRFKDLELTRDLRQAMRRETEMLVEDVLRNDRPLVTLLDADFTFLNERLAKFYAIEGVKGDEMRRVPLPPGSPRGGVLTQATVLTVTSNPDRTSPVKRGLFILENILGTPPPPPPPDIPPLEDSARKGGKPLTLRETLAIHRESASCASCHNRMDPLGLALENFNALGRWREAERNQKIDASGKLVTGEAFDGVRGLKKVLVDGHRREFERCLAEKLLTYALGRGLEAADVEAVDRLVDRVEASGGRASALLTGVIESVPFQKRRRIGMEADTGAKSKAADARTDDPTHAIGG